MPVIWTGNGEAMDAIGRALPCYLCGASIGAPCSAKIFALDRGMRTHRQRHEMAEVLGSGWRKPRP